MKDIFIAYPAEDKKTARLLVQKLETAGYSCKIFPRDLNDKSNYKTELEETLSNCSMFVLLYSDFAQKSDQLTKQVLLAEDFGLKIVPMKTGSVSPSLSNSLLLHKLEWVDVQGDGFKAAYEILLEIIEEVNQGKAPEERIAPKEKKKKPSTGTKRNNITYYVTAAILVLVLVLVFIINRRTDENTADNTNLNAQQPAQVDLTDAGDISDLDPDEQKLVGEWVVTDYIDNQNLPEEEKRLNKEAIVGNGRLIFNADKRFYRLGFSPQVQTAEWSFDADKNIINLIIDGRKEPINLAQFNDSSFTLLTTERTVNPETGIESVVTTRIMFEKEQ
jgi:uncharacterized integral membrane protein